MPKTPKAYQYDQQYIHENLIRVLITFNRKKPSDLELMAWLESQPAKSTYIKELIRRDMEAHRESPD